MASLSELFAFGTSVLLTLFDLDRTFYVPSAAQRKVSLYAWWWGFVIANGVLAGALYPLLGSLNPIDKVPDGLRGAVVGVSYLAIVRLKFTTFSVKGREMPFGLEALYEGAKTYVYRRINRIAMQARYQETMDLAQSLPLDQLTARTKLAINQNAILSGEEKRTSMAWLLSVLQDQASTDLDKRLALADFILSGQRIASS